MRSRLVAVLSLVAVLGLASLAGAGAAAASSPRVDVYAQCYVVEDGRLYAVYGYTSSFEEAVTYGRGPGILAPPNYVVPYELDGAQPTVFEPGDHPGALVLGPLDNEGHSSWYLANGFDSTDAYTRPLCSGGPALPAGGNGTGALLVLLASLPVALVVLRRRS